MKKITYTKINVESDYILAAYEIKVDGIVIGTVEKQEETTFYNNGQRTRSIVWIQNGNHKTACSSRSELTERAIVGYFGLTPYENYDGGIKQTVAEFLAA